MKVILNWLFYLKIFSSNVELFPGMPNQIRLISPASSLSYFFGKSLMFMWDITFKSVVEIFLYPWILNCNMTRICNTSKNSMVIHLKPDSKLKVILKYNKHPRILRIKAKWKSDSRFSFSHEIDIRVRLKHLGIMVFNQ